MDPVRAALLAQGAPLLAAAIILLFLRRRRATAATLAIASVVVSLVASIAMVRGVAVPNNPLLAQSLWLPIQESRGLAFGVLLDTLSTVMALVVAAVTLAVMIYSLGYMAGDPGYPRYYGLLALFAASMQGLVLASSLLQMLVFWELVGLASFLLIGFWFDRPAPAAAARKAFIMTRVGDVGFLLGVLLLIRALGNATIHELVVAANEGTLSPELVTLIAGLLLMGVVGKSAQGPLFTWLPDAMEGPTPVSALLHSATMVAAGVYLVARLHAFFLAAPEVMQILFWIALVTALAAATMAMVARDIKRVLAYSSISQLAWMLMALAAGSLAAGFFHLITHAGYKALLFLAAGMLIHHAHANEMDAIAAHAKPPRAAAIGLIAGALALAGIIPFSGYFSKEAILASLGAEVGSIVLMLVFVGAGLTAYYAARMVFLTLRGTNHPIAHTRHPTLAEKAAAFMMSVPVLVLSALTLVLGLLEHWIEVRVRPGMQIDMTAVHWGPSPIIALTVAAAGIALAWIEFGARGARRTGFVDRMPALREFFANNWYLDRLYGATFVKLAHALSRLARWNDQAVLDGAGDGVAAGTAGSGRLLSRIQSGQVQTYVALAVAVLAVLAVWLLNAEGVL